eukprot:gb/GECG01005832.1/.p1 GENE.gb/GECG01005832.1/~~gb/GECG01005832.1/.p1  ORF type:complete len:2099 (+),score=239.87 gb/GECG01005832.1/:1-6297(+)
MQFVHGNPQRSRKQRAPQRLPSSSTEFPASPISTGGGEGDTRRQSAQSLQRDSVKGISIQPTAARHEPSHEKLPASIRDTSLWSLEEQVSGVSLKSSIQGVSLQSLQQESMGVEENPETNASPSPRPANSTDKQPTAFRAAFHSMSGSSIPRDQHCLSVPTIYGSSILQDDNYGRGTNLKTVTEDSVPSKVPSGKEDNASDRQSIKARKPQITKSYQAGVQRAKHRRIKFDKVSQVDTFDTTRRSVEDMLEAYISSQFTFLERVANLDFSSVSFWLSHAARGEMKKWLNDLSSLVVLHKFQSPVLYAEYVLEHTLHLLNFSVDNDGTFSEGVLDANSRGTPSEDDVTADSIFCQICFELLRHLILSLTNTELIVANTSTSQGAASYTQTTMIATLSVLNIVRSLTFQGKEACTPYHRSTTPHSVLHRGENGFRLNAWNTYSYLALWKKTQHDNECLRKRLKQKESRLETLQEAYKEKIRRYHQLVWRFASRTALLAKQKRDLYFAYVISPVYGVLKILQNIPEQRAQCVILKAAASLKGGVNSVCVMKQMLLLSPERRKLLFTGISAWLRVGDAALRQVLFHSRDSNMNFDLKRTDPSEEKSLTNSFNEFYSGVSFSEQPLLLQQFLGQFIEEHTVATNLRVLLEASEGVVEEISSTYESGVSQDIVSSLKTALASQFGYMIEAQYYEDKKEKQQEQEDQRSWAYLRESLDRSRRRLLDEMSGKETIEDTHQEEIEASTRENAAAPDEPLQDGSEHGVVTMDQEETRQALLGETEVTSAAAVLEHRIFVEEARPLIEDARLLSGFAALVYNVGKAIQGYNGETWTGISASELSDCVEEPALTTAKMVREIESLKNYYYDTASKLAEETEKREGLEREVNVLRWRLGLNKNMVKQFKESFLSEFSRRRQLLSSIPSEKASSPHGWSWKLSYAQISNIQERCGRNQAKVESYHIQEPFRSLLRYNYGLGAFEQYRARETSIPSVTISWNPLVLAELGLTHADAYMLGSDFVQSLIFARLEDLNHQNAFISRIAEATKERPNIPTDVIEPIRSYTELKLPLSRDQQITLQESCFLYFKHWAVFLQRQLHKGSPNSLSPLDPSLRFVGGHVLKSLFQALGLEMPRSCFTGDDPEILSIFENCWRYVLFPPEASAVTDKGTQTVAETDSEAVGAFTFSTYDEDEDTSDVVVVEEQTEYQEYEEFPKVDFFPARQPHHKNEEATTEHGSVPFSLPLYLPNIGVRVTYNIDDIQLKRFNAVSSGHFPLLTAVGLGSPFEAADSTEPAGAGQNDNEPDHEKAGQHRRQSTSTLSEDSISLESNMRYILDESTAYKHCFRGYTESLFCSRASLLRDIVTTSVDSSTTDDSEKAPEKENSLFFALKSNRSTAFFRIQRCHLLQGFANRNFAMTVSSHSPLCNPRTVLQQRSMSDLVAGAAVWNVATGETLYNVTTGGKPISSTLDRIVELFGDFPCETMLESLLWGKRYVAFERKEWESENRMSDYMANCLEGPCFVDYPYMVLHERSLAVQRCDLALYKKEDDATERVEDRQLAVDLQKLLMRTKSTTKTLFPHLKNAIASEIPNQINYTAPDIEKAPWSIEHTHRMIKLIFEWVYASDLLQDSIAPESLYMQRDTGENSGFISVLHSFSLKFFREPANSGSILNNNGEEQWITSFKRSVEAYSLLSPRCRIFGLLTGWTDSLDSTNISQSIHNVGAEDHTASAESLTQDSQSSLQRSSVVSTSSPSAKGAGTTFREMKQYPSVNTIRHQMDALELVLAMYTHLLPEDIKREDGKLPVGSGGHVLQPRWSDIHGKEPSTFPNFVSIPLEMDFDRNLHPDKGCYDEERTIVLTGEQHATETLRSLLINAAPISRTHMKLHCDMYQTMDMLRYCSQKKQIKIPKVLDKPSKGSRLYHQYAIQNPLASKTATSGTGTERSRRRKSLTRATREQYGYSKLGSTTIKVPKSVSNAREGSSSSRIIQHLTSADVVVGLAMNHCFFNWEEAEGSMYPSPALALPYSPSTSIYDLNLNLLHQRCQRVIEENVLPRIRAVASAQSSDRSTDAVKAVDQRSRHFKLDIDSAVELGLLGWHFARLAIYDQSLVLSDGL